jgi:glucokinase
MPKDEPMIGIAHASENVPCLIADVGGTHARFALAPGAASGVPATRHVEQLSVAQFGSFEAAARHYLKSVDVAPDRAVLAVAGPIQRDEVRITNSPWKLSARELEHRLNLNSVRFLNDFAAVGAALSSLSRERMVAIGPHAPPVIDADKPAVYGLIGPGTGLGVGVLLVGNGRSVVLETEGGHASFAPVTAEEMRIHEILTERFGRVSNERLISGSGLLNIYTALCRMQGASVRAAAPEEVTRTALVGTDPQAMRAVEVFSNILGSIAGDVVMTCGAWNGIYLAGGLVKPLLPWLSSETFRARFQAKGRIEPMMLAVPTIALLEEHVGLLGAAAIASSARVAPHRWQ